MSKNALKLSKSELTLLDLVSQRKQIDISEIRSSLGLSSPRISELVKSLREKKLVKEMRHGVGKAITLSDAKHAQLYAELRHEFEHMDLTDLLSGTNLDVLSAVSYLHLRSRAEIQRRCLASEITIAKALLKLKERGVVFKNTTYTVSPRFHRLKEFVIEFRHLMNTDIASRISNKIHIVWEGNHEFIVECESNVIDQKLHPTGISIFGRYGAPFFLQRSYLFYSPFTKIVSLDDAVLHSLLVGGDPLPTLIVWWMNRNKLDMDYLRREGRQYGVEGMIDDVAEFFESKGSNKKPPLPQWIEFIEKYRRYETT